MRINPNKKPTATTETNINPVPAGPPEMSPELQAEIDKITVDLKTLTGPISERIGTFNKELGPIDLAAVMETIGKLFEQIVVLYYDNFLGSYKLEGAKLYIQKAWESLLKQGADKNRVKRPDGFDILHLAAERIKLIESIKKHINGDHLRYLTQKKHTDLVSGGGYQPKPAGGTRVPPKNP